MKIIRFKYEDRFRKWKLNSMKFQKLNLLVGASGVGKTQILDAIADLKTIAEGYSINGLKWEIEFSTAEADYFWTGEFEKQAIHDFFKKDDKKEQRKKKRLSKIIKEKLCRNNTPIIERDQENIFFKQNKTVKLPQEESAINLLKEEDDIAIVYKSFQKIIPCRFENRELIISSDMTMASEKYNNINKIRKSDEDLTLKLYLASVNAEKEFSYIKYRFIEIFPHVEDLEIRKIFLISEPMEVPFIFIKEKGVDEWIHEDMISSGMLRSLQHISELHLCSDGTVILVDEFENSLGINCIDEITNEIVYQKRDLQFIITSHHLYIINQISHKNWKLITRKAGVVTAKDADEFKLSRSKHEAFTQLINLDAYAEGIEV